MPALVAAESSDWELLRAWSEGDGIAGRALLDRHFEAVYRFLGRHLSGDALTDMGQQVWLSCLSSASRFRGQSSFRTYLLGIARNQLRVYFRAHTKEEPADTAAYAVDPQDSPSEQVALSEREALLREALRRMPREHREVLELSFWSDLSGRQIAARLNIPEPTVRSRLQRATERLRVELRAMGAGDDARFRHVRCAAPPAGRSTVPGEADRR